MHEITNLTCQCVLCATEKGILLKKIKGLEEENLRLQLELKEFRERYWLKTNKEKGSNGG